ncbi:MAG: hypothetical protein ACKO3B_13270, partial [Bacteroidota bacterium]
RNKSGKNGSTNELSFPLETIYTDIKPRRLCKLLSHVEFSGSIGGGLSRVTQELLNLGLFQGASQQPIIFGPPSGTPSTGFTSWPVAPRSVPLNITANTGDFLFNTENQRLRYRGQGIALPVEFMASTSFKRFRVGVGAGVYYFGVSELRSVEKPGQLRAIAFSNKTLAIRTLYLYAGYDVYRWQDLVLAADLQVGKPTLGKAFDLPPVTTPIFVGAGVTIRKEITEYFSLFARPSLTLTGYRYSPGGSGEISQRALAFTVSAGVTIRVPELPRCFVKTCGVQMNHPHGNREYRSRMHPIYKRQNPGYGENYGPPLKPVGTKVKD